MAKARRVDLSPDNFIAGIAGLVSAEELGVYWLMCLLYYSHGGDFDYDEKRFLAMLPGTHWRSFRTAFGKLESIGKITLKTGSGRVQVSVKGCSGPLDDALRRIARASQNGVKGGRPTNETNGLQKPNGFHSEKLPRDAPSPSPSLPVDVLLGEKLQPGGLHRPWKVSPTEFVKAPVAKPALAVKSLGDSDVPT